jgi:hypothetical protein
LSFRTALDFFSATNAIAAWPDIHLQEQRGTAVHED